MQVEQTADSAEDFGHLIDVLCNLVEYETGVCLSHTVCAAWDVVGRVWSRSWRIDCGLIVVYQLMSTIFQQTSLLQMLHYLVPDIIVQALAS